MKVRTSELGDVGMTQTRCDNKACHKVCVVVWRSRSGKEFCSQKCLAVAEENPEMVADQEDVVTTTVAEAEAEEAFADTSKPAAKKPAKKSAKSSAKTNAKKGATTVASKKKATTTKKSGGPSFVEKIIAFLGKSGAKGATSADLKKIAPKSLFASLSGMKKRGQVTSKRVEGENRYFLKGKAKAKAA